MIIYLGLLFGCLGVYWTYVKLSSYNNKLIPKIPKNFNLNNFRVCFKELSKWLIYAGEYSNDVGGVSKFNYGPVVVYVVSNPEDASTVLTRCTSKSFVYDLIKPYVGSQLIASDYPVWKRNRRLLDLAFKQNILNGYVAMFNKRADALVIDMSKEINKEVDFTHLFSRYLLGTACYTTLGVNVNDQEVSIDSYLKSVDKLIKIMLNRFVQPWLLLDFVFKFSELKKEQDVALEIVQNFSEEVIRKKKMQFALNSDNPGDVDEDNAESLLDILIKNRNEDEISDRNMREIVDNVILAAYDSNVYMMLYILVCIGSYPEVQKKVYDEVISVTGQTDRDITHEDLPKLVYLEAVVKEAIRLYPAGPIVGRVTTFDTQLKDYVLPAGCQVIVHLGAINRNKEHWGQDADDFRPERWFDSLPKHPAAYSSFSPGRRSCIGKSYSIMLLKTMALKIIKKFYISSDDKKLDFEFGLFLKPIAGHHIKLELR
ncbi:cytochrome P450 4C1-like [Danaus plexippus]|uniref:cytochrome P450 4C1-like n=1 Tax=Danaus plexippus TaxID=13037 RepID=UPI002AAF4482|nr:cytochrome P450 4C1-like [Danaus plexippus]